MGVETAILGSAGLGIVGSVLGGKAQADAAKSAASTQVASADKSLAMQERMFNKQNELQAPWREQGLTALKKYAESPAFSFSYNDITASPDYKFRLQQGVNAMDMSAAARGKLLSGSQDKALQQYGQGMASQEFQNAYGRALQNYNTEQNRNLNIANIGQGAVGQTQNAMQNYSTSAGNTIMNQGNALAQGQLGAGAATAGMYGGATQALQQGLGNALMYNMYQKK